MITSFCREALNESLSRHILNKSRVIGLQNKLETSEFCERKHVWINGVKLSWRVVNRLAEHNKCRAAQRRARTNQVEADRLTSC